MSSRSEDEMSQWRRSLISVKIHGLTSAPLATITAEQLPPSAASASTSS
eukprot:CAMPEP_0184398154 /NCGR_PEP_ID=MMETSP0007-20130409/64343_1 /TAXON_ID=97485 /ORGANISM="Prymnesium parvum, Strain Texoma1" /LENGTH=48 /DNA_ID= /DNA_START= /DNA_END= /DNA_ORIENTATION=